MADVAFQMQAVQQALDQVVLGQQTGNWGRTRFALILYDGLPYLGLEGRKKDGASGNLSLKVGAPGWPGMRDGKGEERTYLSAVRPVKAAQPNNLGMTIAQEGYISPGDTPIITQEGPSFFIVLDGRYARKRELPELPTANDGMPEPAPKKIEESSSLSHLPASPSPAASSRNEWDRFPEMVRFLQSVHLNRKMIAKEVDLELQLCLALRHWLKKHGNGVRVLNYHKSEAHNFAISNDYSPCPIMCMGSSSWPDIGIFVENAERPLRDRNLVAVEAKILGPRNQSDAQVRGWIWNGIGQALVNTLGYRHSILFAYDCRIRRKLLDWGDDATRQSLAESGVTVIVRECNV